MEGLIAEGEEMIKTKGDPAAIDAGLIAAAQRVEHYEMVVGQRQPQLRFDPRQLFGKRCRFARQAPIVFSPTQIVALDKTGVYRGARTRRRQFPVNRISITKHNPTCHLHDPSFLSSL